MTTPTSLRQRLRDAEAQFLAVASNGQDLPSFASEWTTLCDDFEKAFQDGLVDQELQADAQRTFMRAAALGECFAHLEEVSTAIHNSLMNELDDIFAHMSMKDADQLSRTTDSARRTTSTVPRRRTAVVPSRPSLPHIPAAYDWLLDNLHNPYPPETTKKMLAQQANIQARAMGEWFKTARERIGWEEICRTRFPCKGSRRMARTVAEAIFSGDEGDLKIPFEIAAEFHAMRTKAQSLFATEQALESNSSSVTMASPSPFVWPDSPPSGGSPLSSSRSRPPSLAFSSGDSESDDDKLPGSSPRAEIPVTPVKSRKRSRPVEDDLDVQSLFPALPTQIEAHLSSPFKPLIGKAKHGVTPSNSYASSSRDIPITDSRKRRWSAADSSHLSKRSRTEWDPPLRPQTVSAPVMQSSIDFSAGFSNSSFDYTFHSASSVDACSPQYASYLDKASEVNNPNLSAFDGSDPYNDILSSEGLLSIPEVVQNAPSSTTLRILPLPDQVQFVPFVASGLHRVAPASTSEDSQPETANNGSGSLTSLLCALSSYAYPQPATDIDYFLHELDLVPKFGAVPKLGAPLQDWDQSLTDVAPPTQFRKLGWEDVVGPEPFPVVSPSTPRLPQITLQEPENVGDTPTANFDSLVQVYFGDSGKSASVSALLRSTLSMTSVTTNDHVSQRSDWLAPHVPHLPLLSTSSR